MNGWVSIDCGINDDLRLDGLLIWEADSDYTQTGSNKPVQERTSREELNTLRSFPDSAQNNCYIVPAETKIIRYIIRAGFYYGNYDGLSSPPTFDLFINDVKWTTIITSKNNGEPFYEEIMYENNGSGFFKICLVEVKDGGVPFISSLEAVVLWDRVYSQMENNATYNLVTRTNLGGEEIRFDPLKVELYNRIWSKAVAPSNCANYSGFIDVTATIENNPPTFVLQDSIESNGSDPIILTVDLPQSTSQSAYFVFYITELVIKNSNDSRSMKIEINGQDQGTVEAPNVGETSVITKYPVMVSGSTINITLTRTNESSLPPMIAGMEVFTKWNVDVKQNHTGPSSEAAGFYILFAYSLMIPLVFLLVA